MKRILIVLVLILSVSCKKELVKQPAKLIEKDKMIDIMYDLSILEAMKYQHPVSADSVETSPTAFIRYVGANHDSDYKRLDEWVERIEKWKSEGLQHLYFFVHQNVEKASPLLSAHFIKKLNTAVGTNLKIPQLASDAPELF